MVDLPLQMIDCDAHDRTILVAFAWNKHFPFYSFRKTLVQRYDRENDERATSALGLMVPPAYLVFVLRTDREPEQVVRQMPRAPRNLKPQIAQKISML